MVPIYFQTVQHCTALNLATRMHMRSTVDKSVTQISESTRLTIEGNNKLYKLSCIVSPKMVLVGFKAAWFTAASPTSLSALVNATQDGVRRLPCSLAMTSPRSCCQISPPMSRSSRGRCRSPVPRPPSQQAEARKV